MNTLLKIRLSETVAITRPVEVFDHLKDMKLYTCHRWDNKMELSDYEPAISFYNPPQPVIMVPPKEQTEGSAE